MAKSIFEEMGGTYHEENGYLSKRCIIARFVATNFS